MMISLGLDKYTWPTTEKKKIVKKLKIMLKQLSIK